MQSRLRAQVNKMGQPRHEATDDVLRVPVHDVGLAGLEQLVQLLQLAVLRMLVHFREGGQRCSLGRGRSSIRHGASAS
jgi:hypothetical protein